MTSKLMQWPGKNEDDLPKPASFEDIVDPILDTLLAYYDITPKDIDASPVFEGLDHNEQHVSASILWHLSKEGRIYNMERDRDVLAVMLTHAVQLGIEQGRRIALDSHPASTWRLSYDLEQFMKTGLYRGQRLPATAPAVAEVSETTSG